MPVLGSFGITGWHDTAKVRGPGVTIGRSGASIGVATYVKSDYWPLNTTLYVKDFRGNEKRYIYYLLKSIDFSAFNSGSAQPSLNRNHLTQMPVYIPAINMQQAIAEVLGALDDKIANNTVVSDRVLELAEALYLSDAGDQRTILRDVGRWLSGGTPKTSDRRFWDGSIPWISASTLKSFYVATSDRTLTDAGVANGTRVVPAGSVLFVVRGMSLKREFRVGIAQCSVAFGQDCKAILCDSSIGPTTLGVALYARRHDVLGLVDEAGHGTGRLPTDRLERLELAMPAPERADALEHLLATLIAQGAAAEEESRRLAALRDALLPPLMSGELRVREAESAVAEAT